MLDYTRTMNQSLSKDIEYNKKIDLGIGNKDVRSISDNTGEKLAFLADNKLFLSDSKRESLEHVYSAGKNGYIHPLKFGDGLYFISYGYNVDSSHIGDVGVCLFKYMESTKKSFKVGLCKNRN